VTTPSSRRLPRNFFNDAAAFKIDGVYCKLIPLTQGQFALVWEEDYRWLCQYLWMARWNTTARAFYATRTLPMVNRVPGAIIPMHRDILGLQPGDPIQGDHKWGITLDNRRDQIRRADESQQQHNKGLQNNNKSGFKDVHYEPSRKMFRASIQSRGKRRILGRRKTAEEAFALIVEAAQREHGEFARLS
jgi:hypothetical protein